MTTVLADATLGVMVSDSRQSDGDRVWSAKKVFRIGGALVGTSGLDSETKAFLAWYRGGLVGKLSFSTSAALILTDKGLYYFDCNNPKPVLVPQKREAIGTGAKAAMCAYEATSFFDPRRAVAIACRHDADSAGPVRFYHLRPPPRQPRVSACRPNQ